MTGLRLMSHKLIKEKDMLNKLKLHWPVVLATLSSVYAILVNAGVINTNNKMVTAIVAIVSTVVFAVFHIRLNLTKK